MSTGDGPTTEFGLLLEALLEGRLSGAQQARLNELLAGDLETRRAYVQYMTTLAGVRRYLKGKPAFLEGVIGPPTGKAAADDAASSVEASPAAIPAPVIGDAGALGEPLDSPAIVAPTESSPGPLPSPSRSVLGFIGDCFRLGGDFVARPMALVLVAAGLLAAVLLVVVPMMYPQQGEQPTKQFAGGSTKSTEEFVIISRISESQLAGRQDGSVLQPVGQSLLAVAQKRSVEPGPAEINIDHGARVGVSRARAATVGYWRFENGTLDEREPGTAGNVLDSSGMNNHGTAKFVGSVEGTSFYRADVPMDHIPNPGAANSLSMEFANAGFPNNASHAQYVQIPHADSLQFGSTSSFTIEAWVKLSELATSGNVPLSRQLVVYKKSAGRTDGQMEYAFAAQQGDLKACSFLASWGKPGGYTGRELALAFGSGTTNGNQFRLIISSLEITDLDWHFISVQFDAISGFARFVLDDQIETITGFGPEFAPYTGNGDLHLGIHFNVKNSFNGRFKGLMGEVRISNTALAVDELLKWQPIPESPVLGIGSGSGSGDMGNADIGIRQTNFSTTSSASK